MINWLFNPFQRLQTKTLFFSGIIALILGTVLAYFCNARYKGIFSIAFNANIDFIDPLVSNLFCIGCLTLFLFIAGKLINRKTRFIDVLNTVLFSRIIFYLLILFNSTGSVERITNELLNSIQQSGATASINLSTPDLLLLTIFSIFAILGLIWKVVLLYNGYKVASNARGTRAVMLFIVALILAMICSKLITVLI